LTATSASLTDRLWAVGTGVVVAMIIALFVGWMYREPAVGEA
jgi:hypothetical protein